MCRLSSMGNEDWKSKERAETGGWQCRLQEAMLAREKDLLMSDKGCSPSYCS